VTLTFDLEHLQRIACDAMKFYKLIKFERNRSIRGGVIAISVFDLIYSSLFTITGSTTTKKEN